MKMTTVEIDSYIAGRCMVKIGDNDIIGLPDWMIPEGQVVGDKLVMSIRKPKKEVE